MLKRTLTLLTILGAMAIGNRHDRRADRSRRCDNRDNASGIATAAVRVDTRVAASTNRRLR